MCGLFVGRGRFGEGKVESGAGETRESMFVDNDLKALFNTLDILGCIHPQFILRSLVNTKLYFSRECLNFILHLGFWDPVPTSYFSRWVV
jgi:hypothetical protein